MIWLRNGVVYLLSLVLFVALLAGVVASSINYSLAKPAKVEAWLNQSGIYNGFIDSVIKQAQQSTGDSESSSDGVSLSDVAVQQAAKAAFSPAQLQQYVNTFLDSNYAWLQGKTATPSFVIDLTAAKQQFATQVGQYVTAHLQSLPVCTSQQAAAMQNMDPLTVTCRPSNVNPTTAGQQVTQKLASGDGFLSNPVITAKTINPNGKGNSEPYYQKFSQAPKVYQNATRTPFIFAGIAALAAVGVIFISNRKRRGLRRVATVFILVGLILVGTKFAADAALKQIEKKVFNDASVGDIQHSLTNFAQLVEKNITNFDMYCGIGLLILAAVIFIILLATHGRAGKADKPKTILDEDDRPAPTQAPAKTNKPAMDITGKAPGKPGQASSAPTLPGKPSSPSKPKRPRLIQ